MCLCASVGERKKERENTKIIEQVQQRLLLLVPSTYYTTSSNARFCPHVCVCECVREWVCGRERERELVHLCCLWGLPISQGTSITGCVKILDHRFRQNLLSHSNKKNSFNFLPTSNIVSNLSKLSFYNIKSVFKDQTIILQLWCVSDAHPHPQMTRYTRRYTFTHRLTSAHTHSSTHALKHARTRTRTRTQTCLVLGALSIWLQSIFIRW